MKADGGSKHTATRIVNLGAIFPSFGQHHAPASLLVEKQCPAPTDWGWVRDFMFVVSLKCRICCVQFFDWEIFGRVFWRKVCDLNGGIIRFSRSQWPRGRSAAACLLRLWVRIPPEVWISVVRVVYCQRSATSRSLVHRSPTDCSALLSVLKKPRKWGERGPLGEGGGLLNQKKM